MTMINATGEHMIKLVRDKAGLTDSNQDGATDDDILESINDELIDNIIPNILNANEKDYVVTEVIPFVANKSRYIIPARAMFDRVYDIMWRDSDNVRHELSLLKSQNLADKDYINDTGDPDKIYFEGRYIVVAPNMGAAPNGGLEISYLFRPGALTYASGCRQVSSVDNTTKTITLKSAMPTTWSTSNKFDIHSPYGGHDPKIWLRTATVASGSTITFSQAIDGSTQGNQVEIDDWVCLENTSALTGLPQDANGALIQAVAAAISEAAGDYDKRDRHQQSFDKKMAKIGVVMEPPTRGKGYKLSLRKSSWCS